MLTISNVAKTLALPQKREILVYVQHEGIACTKGSREVRSCLPCAAPAARVILSFIREPPMSLHPAAKSA